MTTALCDLRDGLNRWQLWSLLGWNQIRLRYRRSFFGPAWISLTFGTFAFAIGLLYANLFGLEPSVYLPYFVLGLIVWNFISQILVESCTIYSSMQGYIKEIKMPLSTFVFVVLWKNLIILFFQILIFLLVVFIYDLPIPGTWHYSILGLLFVVLNSMWACVTLSILAARYHDLVEIVGNVLRITFFLTPILWLPGTIGRLDELLLFNPFYHFIAITRSGLLGSPFPGTSWILVIAFTFLGFLAAFFVLGKHKSKVAYWI